MSVRTRLEFQVARALTRLPERWMIRLSGQPHVHLDGLTLDPQLQLLLALRRWRGVNGMLSETPDATREHARRDTAAATGGPIPVGAVRDLHVPGPAGPLPARLYSPADAGGPHPLLVFLHGGGFLLGDRDTHDQPCRLLCRYGGVHVLSVEYRLAPEHRFPAAVDDACAAFAWAVRHAPTLGADPRRVAVGGDSAGGTLSAVVAQHAAANGGPAPALQLLLYPAIDRTTAYPSLELFSDGFFLTGEEIEFFRRTYTGGDTEDPRDPRLYPIKAADLSGLAPAIVATAGFDPLRDEGEAYAHALRAAGTPALVRRFPSLIHGFINMVDLCRAAHIATAELAGLMRGMLAGHPDPGEHAGVREAGA